jgi:hypothetical protein
VAAGKAHKRPNGRVLGVEVDVPSEGQKFGNHKEPFIGNRLLKVYCSDCSSQQKEIPGESALVENDLI